MENRDYKKICKVLDAYNFSPYTTVLAKKLLMFFFDDVKSYIDVSSITLDKNGVTVLDKNGEILFNYFGGEDPTYTKITLGTSAVEHLYLFYDYAFFDKLFEQTPESTAYGKVFRTILRSYFNGEKLIIQSHKLNYGVRLVKFFVESSSIAITVRDDQKSCLFETENLDLTKKEEQLQKLPTETTV